MRGIPLLVISFLFFCNCSHSPRNSNIKTPTDSTFEKVHSEFVTNINFPEGYKFISGVDSNFIRITILDLDKKNCIQFYKENKFVPVHDTLPQKLSCMNYLDSAYRHLPDNEKLVIKRDTNNRTYWTYLLDTTTCRLYCHISFPDNDGYTK